MQRQTPERVCLPQAHLPQAALFKEELSVKAKKGGLVVRLIDIVLNLLFGFIVISTVDKSSVIRLSETTDMKPTKLDKEQVLVVGIIDGGRYQLENPERSSGNAQIPMKKLSSVKHFISERNDYFKKKEKKMKVRIQANWYLPVKYIMGVAIHCDSLKIDKSLHVRLAQAGPNP